MMMIHLPLLKFTLLLLSMIVWNASAFLLLRQQHDVRLPTTTTTMPKRSSSHLLLEASKYSPPPPADRRRRFLEGLLVFATTTCIPKLPVSAKATTTIPPKEAYSKLLEAREELINAAKTMLSKRDVKGFKKLLLDPNSNVNQMDTCMLSILESKALDSESKKAIGTIRTYGVGADVMIMYGGLKGEFMTSITTDNDDDEFDDDDDDDDNDTSLQQQPNWSEVQKYLIRTLDSLQEVIVICRSNGLGK